MMCNNSNHLRIGCFIGFVCFALFALAIVCSQLWDLRWDGNCSRKYQNNRSNARHNSPQDTMNTIHPTMEFDGGKEMNLSDARMATENATIDSDAVRDEDPLVFTVREVPTEIRGVFHKHTGVINYTALVEFVKNISTSASENLQ